MNALGEWLESRAPRERAVLLVGAIAAAVIVLWGLIFAPLRDAAADLRTAVESKERLLIDVRRAQTLAPETAPRTGAGTQSLVVLVDTTRRPHGLEFARTRPDGPNGINVTFQNASFDALLEWLIAIEAEHGVVVETASFSSTRERGLVNGQVFLRRS